MTLQRNQPLAIFMEGALTGDSGKMGFGVLRYSPNPIACVIDSEHAGKDVKDVVPFSPRSCPVVASVEDAYALGAEVFVLGIAPPGGQIPAEWFISIDRAYHLGFSIINGLHDLLAPRYPVNSNQFVWDVRVEPDGLAPSTGEACQLTNKRLLMIGTDMAVGKMTAGLEIWKAALEAGEKAEFIATGQIGITVTGRGVPLDAVRVDFAGGSIEREVMACSESELVIVEGQGSLIHPGSSANLSLIRGSMPTHFVLCAREGQNHLSRVPWVTIPPFGEYIRMYEDLASACCSFPRPVTVGVCLNTAHLSAEASQSACKKIEDTLGLPCLDPVRTSPLILVRKIMDSPK